MFNNPRRFGLILSLLAASVIAVPSYAADDDAIGKAIKGRQAGFQLYSFYAGQLFAMAKGEMDYNSELAATLASNLSSVANLNNVMMWLPKSDNVARAGDTRAKPEIWASDSDIGAKAAAMKDASAALASVAGEGLDALRSKIGDVGKSCKGCHDNFRAKDF